MAEMMSMVDTKLTSMNRKEKLLAKQEVLASASSRLLFSIDWSKLIRGATPCDHPRPWHLCTTHSWLHATVMGPTLPAWWHLCTADAPMVAPVHCRCPHGGTCALPMPPWWHLPVHCPTGALPLPSWWYLCTAIALKCVELCLGALRCHEVY